MAMTHGRLTYFMINSVDISAWCDTADFPVEADTHETTTFGRSAKTYAPGLTSGSFSIGGLYDAATGGPEATLRALLGAPAAPFVFGPEGNATTKVKFTGAAVLKNFRPSNKVGDMVRWTAELQVTDTITKAVFP